MKIEIEFKESLNLWLQQISLDVAKMKSSKKLGKDRILDLAVRFCLFRAFGITQNIDTELQSFDNILANNLTSNSDELADIFIYFSGRYMQAGVHERIAIAECKKQIIEHLYTCLSERSINLLKTLRDN